MPGFDERVYGNEIGVFGGTILEDKAAKEYLKLEVYEPDEGDYFSVNWTTPLDATTTYGRLRNFYTSGHRLSILELDQDEIEGGTAEALAAIVTTMHFSLCPVIENESSIGWFTWRLRNNNGTPPN